MIYQRALANDQLRSAINQLLYSIAVFFPTGVLPGISSKVFYRMKIHKKFTKPQADLITSSKMLFGTSESCFPFYRYTVLCLSFILLSILFCLSNIYLFPFQISNSILPLIKSCNVIHPKASCFWDDFVDFLFI